MLFNLQTQCKCMIVIFYNDAFHFVAFYWIGSALRLETGYRVDERNKVILQLT